MRCATRSREARVRRRARAIRRSRRPSSCVAAYHKAQSRFKARDRKGAAPMFDDAAAACKAASNTDLEIKSNYQAGRSYSFFGEHERRDQALPGRRRRSIRSTATPTTRCCARPRSGPSLGDAQAGRGRAVGAADQVPRRRQHRRGDVAARLARVARAEVRRRDQVVEEADRAGAARRQLLRRGRGAVLARPRATPRSTDTKEAIASWQAAVRDATRPRTTRCWRSTACARPTPRRTRRRVAEISTDPPGLRSEGAGVHVPAARRVGHARASARDGAAAARPRRSRPSASCSKLGLDARRATEARRRSRQDREAVGDRVPLRPRRPLRDVALADALAHPRLPRAVADRREPRALADRVSQGVLGAADPPRRRSTRCRSRCRSRSCARRARSIRSTRATPTRSASPR